MIPEEDRASERDAKVLGVTWNHDEDTIHMRGPTNHHRGPQRTTENTTEDHRGPQRTTEYHYRTTEAHNSPHEGLLVAKKIFFGKKFQKFSKKFSKIFRKKK